MTGKRALDLQCQWVQSVADVYSAAVSYKAPHQWILDNLSLRIYDTPQWKKAPNYVRSYVSGYHDAVARNHYIHLEWRMSFHGTLCLAKDIPDGKWSEIDQTQSHYCYIGRPDRIF